MKKIINGAILLIAMIVLGVILFPKYELMRINNTIDVKGVKLHMHINEVDKILKSPKKDEPMMGAYGFNYPEDGFSVFYGFEGPIKDKVIRIEIFNKKYSILGVRIGDNTSDAFKMLRSKGVYRRKHGGIRDSSNHFSVNIEQENNIVTAVHITEVSNIIY